MGLEFFQVPATASIHKMFGYVSHYIASESNHNAIKSLEIKQSNRHIIQALIQCTGSVHLHWISACAAAV